MKDQLDEIHHGISPVLAGTIRIITGIHDRYGHIGYAVRMTGEYSTNLYPIGTPENSGQISHGWFVVTLDAEGEVPANTPPVLAVPLPLQAGAEYLLVIEPQCSHVRLIQQRETLARIPCTGKESDVLNIMAGGKLGLLSVQDDFRLEEGKPLKVELAVEIDMQPFYEDHQPRLAVMREHDPDLYEQQKRIFEAMPAYARAAASAPKRPADIEISAEKKAQIWKDVMKNSPAPSPVKAAGSSNPLTNAIIQGRNNKDKPE